jgi:hypothetical protein
MFERMSHKQSRHGGRALKTVATRVEDDTTLHEPEVGLPLHPGAPRTRKELLKQAKRELGIEPQQHAPFGFRPAGDRSSAVPLARPGASIVGAARGLRERRRGQVSINGAVATAAAKKLIEKSEIARGEHPDQVEDPASE